MICQYCGTENRPEVNFCRNCGQRLLARTVLPAQPSGENALESSGTAVLPPAQTTVEEPPACPHCGKTVKPGARFCAHCGNALSPAPASSLPPSSAQSSLGSADQPAPLPPNMPVQPVYTPSPPQVWSPQLIVGEYPISHSEAETSGPLKSPRTPRARGRQLPGWLVWSVVGLAVIAVLTVIVLLVMAAPKLLSVLRATETPLPIATSQPTALPQLTPTTTAVTDDAQLLFPLRIQLDTASEPWGVGQIGVLTLTLYNNSITTIHLQRLEILGHWEPTLVFTPTAQKDISPTIAIAPATSWTGTFTFNAQQAGESLVSASAKFERADTKHIEISSSEELQIQVADHSH